MIKRLDILAGPLLGLALAFIITSLFDTTDMRDPIRGVMFTEALNSPVSVDDQLLVRISREKIRDDCPVSSVPYFVSDDARRVPGTPAIEAGGNKELEFIDHLYDLPPELTPGPWTLHDDLKYVCPGVWPPFEHRQAPVRFEVIE